MKITHINPDSLSKNPAFSQAVKVTGGGSTLYIGGQNGIKADGSLAGNDIVSQTEQALTNVIEVLKAAGATQAQVVKMNIYVMADQDIDTAFAASQKIWGNHPTAITVVKVAALGRPGVLLEIDAVCALES